MVSIPEKRLKRIQRFISRMPSLSTTAAKVLEICNNPMSSPNDLNRVISLDPVLIGQVMKLINSAYYGIPNRITSLTRAIIMLGINTVKNLVMASTVMASLKGIRPLKTFAVDQFWMHSLCVGVTAKILARKQGVPMFEHETYFVTGLLHDLGKIAMMSCFPEAYRNTLRKADYDQLSLCSCEVEDFGFTHCNVGHLIATKWKLGHEMIDAIRLHHDPFSAGNGAENIANSVALANQAAHYFQIGQSGSSIYNQKLVASLIHACNLGVEDFFSMKPEIEETIQNAKVFLQLKGNSSAH
jgi:putative nucleotidyltransferase with HDIG domain